MNTRHKNGRLTAQNKHLKGHTKSFVCFLGAVHFTVSVISVSTVEDVQHNIKGQQP